MLKHEELIRRIEKSLAFWGTHTLGDLREDLDADRVRAFMGEHGVWMAQVCDHPQKRLLNVCLLAGELPGVMDVQKQVEDFAVRMNCDLVVAPHVRFGLKDVFKKTGWQVKGYNMSLPLTGD